MVWENGFSYMQIYAGYWFVWFQAMFDNAVPGFGNAVAGFTGFGYVYWFGQQAFELVYCCLSHGFLDR